MLAILRHRLIGVLLCLCLLLLLAATFSVDVPLATALGTVARVTDSLAPQFFGLALLLALVCAVLGGLRTAALVIVLGLAGAGWLGAAHLQRSLPLAADQPAALRVLFFNVLQGNGTNGEKIAEAALKSDADVIAFTEGLPVRPYLARLHEKYPYDVSCPGKNCGFLVMSRRPVTLRQDLAGTDGGYRSRYLTVPLANGRELTLVVAHMYKPWFAGMVEAQFAELAYRLRKIHGPVVLVGDFNAAPWSRPLRHLMDRTGLAAVRWPTATWPVPAGSLGVPIDNYFVRGGARMVSEKAFGDHLGSNHRGLLADIAVTVAPPADPPAPQPKG